jgi:hypothetical protein
VGSYGAWRSGGWWGASAFGLFGFASWCGVPESVEGCVLERGDKDCDEDLGSGQADFDCVDSGVEYCGYEYVCYSYGIYLSLR